MAFTTLNKVPVSTYMGYYHTDGQKYYFGGPQSIEGEVKADELDIMWRNLRAAWYLESKQK